MQNDNSSPPSRTNTLSESHAIALGWHWLVDFSDCTQMPVTAEDLNSIMTSAALKSGATIVQKCFHEFSPHGLSGVVVIAESHIAVHTWPEYRSIAVDFFSCSQKLMVTDAIEVLLESFGTKKHRVQRIERNTVNSFSLNEK